jgi:AbrB family looped-hinge helix DNA binding protein
MSVDTVRMSSKGQIVIPQGLRDEMNLGEGSVLAIACDKERLVLRKIKTPTKEELLGQFDVAAKSGKARLQQKGIAEKDIPAFVEKRRKIG